MKGNERDITCVVIIAHYSLPGYGFSEGAYLPGLGPTGMSQIFLKLMKRLRHEKFYIQAGDWGSIIATYMATFYPEK
jgi:pimeloyl-ACP methyl ester carboxylesterase